jgi:hypothetical protein
VAKQIDASVGEYIDAALRAGAKTTEDFVDCLGLTADRVRRSLNALCNLQIFHEEAGQYFVKEPDKW